MPVASATLDNQINAPHCIEKRKSNNRAVTVGARRKVIFGLAVCWPGRQAELHHPPCLRCSLPGNEKKTGLGPGDWFFDAMAKRESAAPVPAGRPDVTMRDGSPESHGGFRNADIRSSY